MNEGRGGYFLSGKRAVLSSGKGCGLLLLLLGAFCNKCLLHNGSGTNRSEPGMRIRNGNKVNRMSHCDGLSVELNHLLRASPTRATIPAVLAGVPLAVCSQMFMPPQSLQVLLSRLCSQMLALPAVLAGAPLAVMPQSQMLGPCMGSGGGCARRCWHPRSSCIGCSCGYAGRCRRPRSPCMCSSGGCARTSCAPSVVRSAAASASPFPPRFPPPPAPLVSSKLPRLVAVSPLLAALATLVPQLPVPAPSPLPSAYAAALAPPLVAPPLVAAWAFATRTVTVRPRHDHALSLGPAASSLTGCTGRGRLRRVFPCVSLFHVTDTGSPGSLGRLPVHPSSLL